MSEIFLPATVEDIMKQLLRKNEHGQYTCPEEEGKLLCKAINRIWGVTETEDADFEIVELKRLNSS